MLAYAAAVGPPTCRAGADCDAYRQIGFTFAVVQLVFAAPGFAGLALVRARPRAGGALLALGGAILLFPVLVVNSFVEAPAALLWLAAAALALRVPRAAASA
jgi:hypothetical protein